MGERMRERAGDAQAHSGNVSSFARPRWAVLVAVAGALVLWTGDAGAHGGDASKIHACVAKKSGVLRVVRPTRLCRANERAVDFPRSGAVGRTGPAGPQGATGDV